MIGKKRVFVKYFCHSHSITITGAAHPSVFRGKFPVFLNILSHLFLLHYSFIISLYFCPVVLVRKLTFNLNLWQREHSYRARLIISNVSALDLSLLMHIYQVFQQVLVKLNWIIFQSKERLGERNQTSPNLSELWNYCSVYKSKTCWDTQ
mgnify:CR=1 FL=1